MFLDDRRQDYSFVGDNKAFERALGDPDQAPILKSEFVRLVGSVKRQGDFSFACFIETEGAQPGGALKMKNAIGEGLGVQTCVWSRSRNTIVHGHRPHRTERGVIIYDICKTGRTLTNVARELKFQFGAVPKAAIVYINKRGIEELRIPDAHFSIPILDMIRFPETRGLAVASNLASEGVAAESDCGNSPVISLTGAELAEEVIVGTQSANSGFVRAIIFSSIPLLAATFCAIVIVSQPISRLTAVCLVAVQAICSIVGVKSWIRLVKR